MRIFELAQEKKMALAITLCQFLRSTHPIRKFTISTAEIENGKFKPNETTNEQIYNQQELFISYVPGARDTTYFGENALMSDKHLVQPEALLKAIEEAELEQIFFMIEIKDEGYIYLLRKDNQYTYNDNQMKRCSELLKSRVVQLQSALNALDLSFDNAATSMRAPSPHSFTTNLSRQTKSASASTEELTITHQKITPQGFCGCC